MLFATSQTILQNLEFYIMCQNIASRSHYSRFSYKPNPSQLLDPQNPILNKSVTIKLSTPSKVYNLFWIIRFTQFNTPPCAARCMLYCIWYWTNRFLFFQPLTPNHHVSGICMSNSILRYGRVLLKLYMNISLKMSTIFIMHPCILTLSIDCWRCILNENEQNYDVLWPYSFFKNTLN